MLTVPFLVLNSADSAEGVETDDGDFESKTDVPAVNEVGASEQAEVAAGAVEFVVTTQEVSPDIVQLSAQASLWTAARGEAIADGRVEIVLPSPPSDTDLSLLPEIDVDIEPEPEPDEDDEVEAEPDDADEPDATEPEPDPDEDDEVEAEPDDADEPDATEPEPEPEADPFTELPPAPAQVNGRVPPPGNGPTGAQWDALRNCESTHNYQAINASGTFRGAYQFSQQTWDWVAGIHLPFLVGIDPAQAPPGWQDVMAYTLFAMRGWDQWPVCGLNLL